MNSEQNDYENTQDTTPGDPSVDGATDPMRETHGFHHSDDETSGKLPPMDLSLETANFHLDIVRSEPVRWELVGAKEVLRHGTSLAILTECGHWKLWMDGQGHRLHKTKEAFLATLPRLRSGQLRKHELVGLAEIKSKGRMSNLVNAYSITHTELLTYANILRDPIALPDLIEQSIEDMRTAGFTTQRKMEEFLRMRFPNVAKTKATKKKDVLQESANSSETTIEKQQPQDYCDESTDFDNPAVRTAKALKVLAEATASLVARATTLKALEHHMIDLEQAAQLIHESKVATENKIRQLETDPSF